MADNKYELIVHITGNTNTKYDDTPDRYEIDDKETQDIKSNYLNSTDNNIRDIDRLTSAKNAWAISEIIDLSINVIDNVVDYTIALPGSKYSDIAEQNKINNTMSIIKKPLSSAQNIARGAALGGSAGAVAVALAEAVNMASNAYKNYEQFGWTQQKHALDEFRSNERIGNIRSDRNR